MIFSHDISGCLAGRLGAHGLGTAPFEDMLARTANALKSLRDAHSDGSLPLLSICERRDDLERCREAAEAFLRGAEHVVVFGTGGSSLGAQALAQLAGWRVAGAALPSAGAHAPAFHFVDNLDPQTMGRVLGGLDLKTTRFLVVSKSGNTPETVLQMLCALDALKHAGLDWNAAQHFLTLTEPGSTDENAVRRLSEMHGIPILDHNPGIGGRYSVLSNVGLLPAIMLGLDADALRDGAAQVLAPVLSGVEPQACPPAVGAAVQAGLARHCGVGVSVLMPYADRLRMFANWYVQLWAESLGKGGAGTTPVAAAGPVDQHSQMQLFLDGPRDKLVTVITTEVADTGPRADGTYAKDPLVGYLAGKSVGTLVDCEQRAAVETLIRNARPTRHIHLETLDETSMGALLMHFMLETIITGHLMGVDPFDQPAVEEGKRLARDYLSGM